MEIADLAPLSDSFGRTFEYLRLSVTDRCNFKCAYCLPKGYARPEGPAEAELSVSEIGRLARAFARIGFWKVRITGGEPTLRRDIVEIASAVAAVPGVRRVALSTNGYRLASLARELRAAGVTAVNVSLDSLDAARFKEITGSARFEDVTRAVDAALEEGFESVKVNAVLLKDWNHEELPRVLDWLRTRPVTMRFIELMRTGENAAFFERRHLPSGELRLALLRQGWVQREREAGDGPAVEFRHADFRGSIGLIAPYAEGFCANCNRLRVSSRGSLRLCLFGEGEFSLRPFLQDDSSAEELVWEVRRRIGQKAVSHFLQRSEVGVNRNFAQIGG